MKERIAKFIVPVAFISIIIVIIAIWLVSMRQIEIVLQDTNQELSDLPQTTVLSVKNKIQDLLFNKSGKFLNYAINVRPDSASTITEDNNMLTGTFIVDIEELKQSYLVYYSHNKNYEEIAKKDTSGGDVSESIMLFCVSKQEHLIYGSSNCADKNLPDENDLYLYIPGKDSSLSSGKKVEFLFKPNKTVWVLIYGCDKNDDENREAKDLAQKWVESLGFNVDDFTYSVQLKYTNCLIE